MANPDPEVRSGRRVLRTRHICYTKCLSNSDSKLYQLAGRSSMVPTYLKKIIMQRSCTEKNGVQIEGHVKDGIGISLQDASGKQRLSHEL